MAALLKTALYLGAVLLLGAPLFRYHVGPELTPPLARTLKLGVLVGAPLLVAASLGDLAWSVTRLLGRWDVAFIGEYALYTTHGRATLIRLGLVAVLLFVSLKPFRFSRWLLIPLGLARPRGMSSQRLKRKGFSDTNSSTATSPSRIRVARPCVV